MLHVTSVESHSSPGPKPGPWIISTSLDKPDPRTRRHIRSHVMRGRNTRADRRARAEAQSQPRSAPASVNSVCQRAVPDGELIHVPRKIASELALDRYGFEMKPYMLDLMHRAFTTTKPCVYAVDMKLVNETETRVFDLSDIHTHRATIHSILFTAQAFQDLSAGQPCGRIAQFHLGKTLHHLQQSLNDKHGAVAMATIAIVAMLASAAAVFGDLQTVEKHMDGLYRIFELRGGVESLQRGSLVQHKAQRLDLALAMGTNRKPRLFPEEVSWGSQIAPEGCARWYKELEAIHPPPDARLLAIWADLKCYSQIANRAQSPLEVKSSLFLSLSTSVPNRLLHLEYATASLPELMRLSMLAYVKGLLFQIPGIGRNMRYLSDRLRLSLQTQQYPPRPENASLVFWALFVSGLSIFESFDQEWHRAALTETASALGVGDWAQAKKVLGSVPWVDRIYDAGAEAAFKGLLGGDE